MRRSRIRRQLAFVLSFCVSVCGEKKKTVNLGYNIEPLEIETSYFACLLHHETLSNQVKVNDLVTLTLPLY